MAKIKRISPKRQNCFFCQENVLPDYKNPEILSRFISERGKISSRSKTGICARHQRFLTRQIKRARHLSLLPFVTQVR